jgi:uncharacterized protein (DUF433 family)
MNQHTPIHHFVGVGLYSLSDAAQLIKASPRSVRRWLDGYTYKKDGEVRTAQPLWVPEIPKTEVNIELSFRDLIELKFVQGFIEAGIGLKTIRICMNYARQCINNDRPFSSGKFRTDGRTIFLESLEAASDPILLDLRHQQYVIKKVVEQSFKELDWDGNIITRWRPFGGKDSIVIDPSRSFGQPIASISGVPTIALADAVKAEGSIARVAVIYEVDKSVVQDAVKFHQELLAA